MPDDGNAVDGPQSKMATRLPISANNGTGGPAIVSNSIFKQRVTMKVERRLGTLNDAKRQSINELAVKRMSIAEAANWAGKLTVAGMQWKISELDIWVAEMGEKVVWWGGIRGDRLAGLYTDPEFAGRGIGTELLSLLEGLMRGRGILAARAEASANAKEFYLRRGYERTDGRTLEGAQPIRKRLP